MSNAPPGSGTTDGASNDGGSDGGGSNKGSQSNKGKNWLEWTITALGGVLVVLVLGFLFYEWATDTGQPADLAVRLHAAEVDGPFVVMPVTIENKGGTVAVGAVIEVCAGPDACSTLTFDYVPFKSEVTGSVGFRAPLAAEPTARVVSYQDP